MDWLDQNLDAYRIVAEMLIQLRTATQARLEDVFGKEWVRTGLPESVFDRLVASKERERSIDWYESEYQELIDYAVFVDFLEIFEHCPQAFTKITALAPNPALLHARFQELEVMRAKLGRARPISETEFAFLSTFQLRLRDALIAQADEPTPEIVHEVAPGSKGSDVKATGKKTLTDDGADVEVKPPADAKPSARVAPPKETQRPEDKAEENIEVEVEDEVQEQEKAPPKPPKRAVKTPSGPPSKKPPPPKESTLDRALADANTREILRELYKEITVTAEALWSEEPLAPSHAWEKVVKSPWYQQSFSKIGLKPLSDFYEVLSSIHGHMHEGISKEEIQGLLKGYNFAQILLALRDMFQKNNV